ncbi:ATP-binding cassette domain-containing protein [bacterium]|nr:ATP-binding cassette domain-containing protein [bacterium]
MSQNYFIVHYQCTFDIYRKWIMDNNKKNHISIVGAKEHNLNIDSLSIPLYRFTVVTGLSGSGKSSLIHSTLYHEAMRRFLASFSPYTRQHIRKTERPAVEKIENLPAAVYLSQKTGGGSLRSTVATISGISDLLRLLFARFSTSDGTTPLTRALFSFNTKEGGCPHCNGLGVEDYIDEELLIEDGTKTLREGALKITLPNGYTIYSQVTIDVLNSVCTAHDFSVDIPWNELTAEQKKVVLYGTDRIKILYGKHTLESRMKWSGIKAQPREEKLYRGILPVMEEILKKDRNKNILRFARTIPCRKCDGSRLTPAALRPLYRGKNIAELMQMKATQLLSFITEEVKNKSEREITNAIAASTKAIISLGIGYLTGERPAPTLSGGEIQRLKMATQLQVGLSNLLYILDEPSSGLHPVDHTALITHLRKLVKNGNSVIAVDHIVETMRNADYLIDIGPKAGDEGGRVIYAGPPADIPISLGKTAHYLLTPLRDGQASHQHTPHTPPDERKFTISGASLHNLKNVTASFIYYAINIITGVSGAGKSSILTEFKNALPASEVVYINQSPIGKTPRSNPATYTKLFDKIRTLFAMQPDAKRLKLNASSFSFNTADGRCEQCEGAGVIRLGLHFLGKQEVVCDKCNGRRFNKEVLSVRYKEKDISDILDMSVEEALNFFTERRTLLAPLQALFDCGLSYCKLGQSATTLSGGEAQRVKLAASLAKGRESKTVYLMDEPLRGLHPYDADKLLKHFKYLVKRSATFLLIEHDPRTVLHADYIIDIGPSAGEKGGEILFNGLLTNFISHPTSLTAQFLRKSLTSTTIIAPSQKAENQEHPISFKGVKTNNLKNISVSFPANKWSIITGPSGSGKSSLLLGTLYATAHNLYLDTFSGYERERMGLRTKANIDSFSGVRPAIAISGTTRRPSARSTVGSVSTLSDFLRLLFARSAGKNYTTSHFSPNHTLGSCPHCNGLGTKKVCDATKLIQSPQKSLFFGAMDETKTGRSYSSHSVRHLAILKALFDQRGVDINTPYSTLSQEIKREVLSGSGDTIFDVEWHYKRGKREGIESFSAKWRGFIPLIEEEYTIRNGNSRSVALEEVMSEILCTPCGGSGLHKNALAIRIESENIHTLTSMPISSTLSFLTHLYHSKKSTIIEAIYQEMAAILDAAIEVGLGHLSLQRKSDSLSNGEMTRLRLVSLVASKSSGITYLVDEPSDGLHPSELPGIVKILKKIAQTSTLITVDHSEIVIKNADYQIELGPSSGNEGGEILYRGKPRTESVNNAETKSKITQFTPIFSCSNISFRTIQKKSIVLFSKTITALTGVSGSGKTTLLFDVIAPSFRANRAHHCEKMEKSATIKELLISERRFSLAGGILYTFLGIAQPIKKLLTSGEDLFSPSSLSRFSKQGACPLCKGQRREKMTLDFIAETETECELCNGTGYNNAALALSYQTKNIGEIENLTIKEAFTLFSEEKKIANALKKALSAGVGHLKLGVSTTSLSHGEQIRISLLKQLLLKDKRVTLYLLDEPTAGQNSNDILHLYNLLDELRQDGSTILLSTHHPLMMQLADKKITL